jgi:GT2 family glycosyltransferase
VIEAIGVVVPAHNEEELLPGCLAALRRAAAALATPVDLLVAADSCTDRTAEVALGRGARTIDVRARSVGVARAAGMAELLRMTAGTDPAAVWLATTDADTAVPPSWLSRQLAYANQGWDVVLGTVAVADWDEHPPHLPAVFEARYRFGAGPHPHVHGANLGLRASAYLAAGGFRPLRTAEDHALLNAATEAGCRILRASDIAVITSGRRHARAPDGFSHLLRILSQTLGGRQPARPGPAARRASVSSISASSPVTSPSCGSSRCSQRVSLIASAESAGTVSSSPSVAE